MSLRDGDDGSREADEEYDISTIILLERAWGMCRISLGIDRLCLKLGWAGGREAGEGKGDGWRWRGVDCLSILDSGCRAGRCYLIGATRVLVSRYCGRVGYLLFAFCFLLFFHDLPKTRRMRQRWAGGISPTAWAIGVAWGVVSST